MILKKLEGSSQFISSNDAKISFEIWALKKALCTTKMLGLVLKKKIGALRSIYKFERRKNFFEIWALRKALCNTKILGLVFEKKILESSGQKNPWHLRFSRISLTQSLPVSVLRIELCIALPPRKAQNCFYERYPVSLCHCDLDCPKFVSRKLPIVQDWM